MQQNAQLSAAEIALIHAIRDEVGLDPDDRLEFTGGPIKIVSMVKGRLMTTTFVTSPRGRHGTNTAIGAAEWLLHHLRRAAELREGTRQGPLASNMNIHPLMESVMSQCGVDIQTLLDRLWQRAAMVTATNGTIKWATDHKVPDGITAKNLRNSDEHVIEPVPNSNHLFLRGSIDSIHWYINMAVINRTLNLHIDGNGYYLTTPGTLPETILLSLKGRPLASLISHAALNKLELTIRSARNVRDRLNVRFGGDALKQTPPFQKNVNENVATSMPRTVKAIQRLVDENQ